jgi:hypothetical protein
MNILEKKGQLATLIGMAHAVPAGIWLFHRLFTNYNITEHQWMMIALIELIAIMWFILPSRISAKWGKGELIVED